MNRITTRHWLIVFFLCTTMLDVDNIAAHGFSDKPIIRISILGYLFVQTFKRVQWARFLLATLYVLGGVVGINTFSSNLASLNFWIIGGFGVFCVSVSIFLVKSKSLDIQFAYKEKSNSDGLSL